MMLMDLGIIGFSMILFYDVHDIRLTSLIDFSFYPLPSCTLTLAPIYT